MKLKEAKKQIKEKANEMAKVLERITYGYHGKIEVSIQNGKAINVNIQESIDMR